MKKICLLFAALLIGSAVFDASAQLKIGSTKEGGKRLAVLQMEWNWLYLLNDHYFFVTKTTNQFDDWIWLDLGETKDMAIETVNSLIELLNNSKKDEDTEIESLGKPYTLMCTSALGIKYFNVYSSDRSGLGNIQMQSLKKALTFLQKE